MMMTTCKVINMKIRNVLTEQVNFKEINNTINNYVEGGISRDRFVNYLQAQLKNIEVELTRKNQQTRQQPQQQPQQPQQQQAQR